MSDGMHVLTRRRFLGGLAVVAAALVPGVVAARTDLLPAGGTSTPASRLVALFDGRQAEVAAIGRHYLEKRPPVARPDDLLANVTPAGAPVSWPRGVDDEQLRATLDAIIREELRTGRLEHVGTWLLSPTEAALAGLVALQARR